MDIKVYTKKRCPYCVSAKHWLSQREYSYTEISLDDPMIKEDFVSSYPDLRTVPQIFIHIDGEDLAIGGFTELTKSEYFR